MSELITHNVTQGTQPWLDLRKNYHTASEANAMMGTCPHISRNELLTRKKTGMTPEPTSFERKIFAEGHRCEALARPIIEQQVVGEDLFQIVATRGKFLASFDGLTLFYDIAFEHKLWNEDLAKKVKNGIVPDSHVFQLEQQLYVSGAERVLFVVSDGTPQKMVSCWYESDPVKRQQLMHGWETFEKDLETHETGVIKLEGRAIDRLPSLDIQIESTVIASNLDQYTGILIQSIESISTDLTTDQDFVDASEAAKWCKSSENAIVDIKAQLIKKTVDVNNIIGELDQIAKKMSEKRRLLEKLVKDRRAEIKDAAIAVGIAEITKHLNAQPINVMHLIKYDFKEVTKSKKTLSSTEDAVHLEVTRVKAEVDLLVQKITTGMARIEELGNGYEFLFSHKQQLAEEYEGKTLDAEIHALIDSFKEQNSLAAKQEAERMIEQAKRQKAEKQRQNDQSGIQDGLTEFSPVEGDGVSATELNKLLHFDHAELAKQLHYDVQDAYSKSDAAAIVKTMIAHLQVVHADLMATETK